MDFNPTYTLPSKTLPGVVATLRRVGPRERGSIEMSLAGARAKERDISHRHEVARQKLNAAIAACPKDAEGKPIQDQLSPETLVLAFDVQGAEEELKALSRCEISPVFVKAALLGFEGDEPLTYEGKPATADLLCTYGPDGLFDEVVAAINANGYLPGETARNLKSPSTSGAPVAGEVTTTIAPNAKPDDSTSSGTVQPGTRNG